MNCIKDPRKGPKISVIMPCLNGEAHIEAAIHSVLDQTWQNWELLVIDNGSSDNSMQLVNGFRDIRIRTFTEPHKGVSRARNLGLNEASGEFICFLDCDDVLPIRSLESRAVLLQDDHTVSFADGQVLLMSEDLSTITRHYEPMSRTEPLHCLLRSTSDCFVGLTWMIRARLLRNIRFDVEMTHAEDLDLFIRLAAQGGKYQATQEVILHYRSVKGSAMTDLQGLEQGYRRLNHKLKAAPELFPKGPASEFRSSTRSIMFKSYLKQLRPLSALRTLLVFGR